MKKKKSHYHHIIHIIGGVLTNLVLYYLRFMIMMEAMLMKLNILSLYMKLIFMVFLVVSLMKKVIWPVLRIAKFLLY